MDDKSFHVRIPKRWARTALVVAATALIVAPLSAVASHSFVDVPESNIFHNDIAWLKDADVTRGCNPPANDRFCPFDNVTRQQMAAFMNRLANNQVVNAATAVTAGTAFEAVNAGGKTLSGTSAANADSIATISGLEQGAYVVTASWNASAEAGAEALIVCDLTAGGSSTQAVAHVNDPEATDHSMSAVLTADLGEGDDVNLSCWREDETGDQSVTEAHIVAYPVLAVDSNDVTE